MKFKYFSIKYCYSDTLLKKHKLHLSRLFCCNHTCYCVNMVSVTSVSHYITSASCYHPRYQCRSTMYIRGLIPWNFAELAETVLTAVVCDCGISWSYSLALFLFLNLYFGREHNNLLWLLGADREFCFKCRTDWVQIRTNRRLVLIWVQTVCKGYQQMTKVAANVERVNT